MISYLLMRSSKNFLRQILLRKPLHKSSRKSTNSSKIKIVYTGRPFFVKTASVAAIVVIISAVMLLNFNRKKSTQYTEVNQQSASLQNDEKNFGADLSLFSKELEQLNSELVAINLGEDNGTNGILTNQVDQVELEIIETENTFWKG